MVGCYFVLSYIYDMGNYIELRCQNKTPRNHDRCGHILGGIESSFLGSEIRYCPSCNVFWKVTKDADSLSFERVKGRINMVPAEKDHSVVVTGGVE